jgi:hypothetical protein
MRRAKLAVQILAAPETNLFLFAFLVNFVYEVWQSPYFEFYRMPSLADKVNYITHCTVGDGIITVISYSILSLLRRDRDWIFTPTWKLTLLFASLGWIYTLVSEIYRVQVAKLYGVSVLVVPSVGISWLPLLQWMILPPIVLFLARRQMLGYRNLD